MRGVSSQVVLCCCPLYLCFDPFFPVRHCCSGLALRMLVTQNLCNAVFTGVAGVPDLRSAADLT